MCFAISYETQLISMEGKMKFKLFTVGMVIVFAALITGCDLLDTVVIGNGKIVEKRWSVNNVHALELNLTESSISVVSSEEEYLVVKMDSNLFDYADISTGGTVSLASGRGYRLEPSRKISATLFVNKSSLSTLKINGSSSAKIEREAANETFKSYINGSGDITINGNSIPFSFQKIEINGSGDYSSRSIPGSRVHAEINGSGDITLGDISDSLDVEINGSGDISYGHVSGLSIDRSINGSGSIRSR